MSRGRRVTVVLYRPSLDARSGAGQLLEMQRRGLESAGVAAVIGCERGAWKFWLRTGVRARRFSPGKLAALRAEGALVVDHGLSVPDAEIVFVHNLASEVARHVPDVDLAASVSRERAFFHELNGAAAIVANSRLVADALQSHFEIARERVAVLYPGYRADRYSRERAAELRAGARKALGVDPQAPLVGFVTSGDFAKRGLDLFLDCAARIASERRDARFLVVGSKQLPDHAREHPLVRKAVLQHRAKSRRPEPWFAALDLFLYTARFEEYGIVLAEAQAMGVPVLTSRLVGASECLPAVYAPWLLDRPESGAFAERALALLADGAERARLAAAAAESVVAFDERSYANGTLRLVAAQNRRLK